MTVTIRRSGPDEAETHFQIQRAASLAGMAHVFPPAEYPYPDDAIRERWRRFAGTVLVADRDGRAVGVAGIEDGWLHGFYVRPEEWGSDVAAVLHRAAVEQGVTRLWCLERNHRARRFYEKRGWRTNGRTRVVDYAPHPLDVGYSRAPVHGVIFDLWDTLIGWDEEMGQAFLAHVAEALGATPAETQAAWDEGRPTRSAGPMLDYLRTLGLEGGAAAAIVERRREFAKRAIVPVDGAVETIRELRRRGLKVGLLSVCSDEVPAVWADTAFAGLFDAEIFSCDVGLLKPDPRIYALTCERLGVQPQDALFVGDGANDELAGAERAGVRAVQIQLNGEEPRWPEARDWTGPRISAIPQVLELV